MNSYSIYYQKYNIFANAYVQYIKDVKTDDVYHEVGKIVCSSLERVSKISYVLNKNGITQNIIDYRLKCGLTRLCNNTWIRENIAYNIYGEIVWVKENGK